MSRCHTVESRLGPQCRTLVSTKDNMPGQSRKDLLNFYFFVDEAEEYYSSCIFLYYAV